MHFLAIVSIEPGGLTPRTYGSAFGIFCSTPNAGYHETLTRFYVEAIARVLDSPSAVALRQRGSLDVLDTLAAAVIEVLGERDLPLRFYSRACLFSSAARAAWVEPDVAPLSLLQCELGRAPAVSGA